MESKTKKKSVLLILLLVVFCTAAGAFSAVYFTDINRARSTVASSGKENSTLIDVSGSAIDGMSESKTPEQVLEELKKAQINVTDEISSHILFPSGKKGTSGNWTVENPVSNNVMMQCEVFLGDKLIARSVSIRPDQHFESVCLLEDVEAGTYDVTAYVNYYDTQTIQYISKAGYQIKLTVQ